MSKRLLKLIFLAALFICVWKVWNPLWKYDLNEAVDAHLDKKIVFTIIEGESAKTIATDLENSDLIISANSFTRTLKEENLDGLVRHGSFVLSPSMTLRDIITILTTEGSGEMAITVTEGQTIADIDARLTEMTLTNSNDFTSCTKNRSLEGFLFPDTYFLDSSNFSSEELINRMLKNFDSKWTPEMDSALASSGRTMQEIIIVASMLEKEVQTPEDMALASGIIWKRLDAGWTLGIDATWLYTTPYDTRSNTGLPPTAIGNPGLNAIKAALTPTPSDYWFYLTDSSGTVHYAKTNAEHEENKGKWL
ncbi:MAG: endolytic transglycosylase MltG [Candidatus Gracilibacteria bacterium]|jgi:UPF0755 protein